MYYDIGRLSVVMPAYNEGDHIFDNALEVSRTIASFVDDYEIVIVNDGSRDDTLKHASRASLKDSHIVVVDSQPNKGKGHALQTGTESATGQYIAFCDADLDLHPRQLERFVEIMLLKQCDVVIGSKQHPESKVNYPWHRKIMSYGYYLFLWALFRLKIKDTQTGLKLFKAEAIKPVMKQILVKRFAFDIEVLAILNSRQYKIESAPIELVFNRGSLGSRIGIKDVYNMMLDTLAIFYRLYIMKHYDKELELEAIEKHDKTA